jgi:Glycosyltransferases involved in cell wall biogenesis
MGMNSNGEAIVGGIKTSVVIPTFNRANLVGEAIESSLRQTVAVEVIVVNHGSTDETDQVVKGFGDRVRYIRKQVDFGPIYAWVDGVLHASGNFVKLLFDDDIMEPNFVESCEELMLEDVGFVFSMAEVHTGLGKGPVETLFTEFGRESRVAAVTGRYRRRLETQMLSPSAMLVRRADLLDSLHLGRLPLQSHTYHGAGPDHFVKLLAMLRYKKFGFVAKPLVKFRAHSGSITVAAHSDYQSSARLATTYRDVLLHYLLLRDFGKFRWIWGLAGRRSQAKSLVRGLGKVMLTLLRRAGRKS